MRATPPPLPVVVLAAGRGTRLSPLTDAAPKCLVEVGGTTPLGSLLDALAGEESLSEIVLVVGHAHERIAAFLARRPPGGPPTRLVFNPRWDTANNIVSALLARPIGAAGFVLVNSDVLCEQGILHDAIRSEARSFLVVDETLPPRNEAMKVTYRGGRLVAIAKTLDPAAANGEYIGVTRFDAAGARAFFASIERILARGGSAEWYEAAIAEAAGTEPFGLLSTAGRAWIEIDDHGDRERAEREIVHRLRSRGA